MKKICFLSHTSELNGAELNLLQILEGIDRQKYDPCLLVPREGLLSEETAKLGIETGVIPFKWGLTEKEKMWKQPLAWIWNKRAVSALSGWIEQRQVDLVFSNSSASWSGALAAKKTHRPHVWYIHEILGGKAPQLTYLCGQRALARKIVRLSCRVLVNSLATEAFFEDKANVRLVYNGIRIQEIEKVETQELGRQWGFRDGDLVFGIIGKICEAKGQREVIEALGKIGKDYPLKLLLVGEVKSKTYFSKLQNVCDALEISDRVIFAGYRRDVQQVLALMDCLIVASRTESFGRTITEALSVKTPVIAVRSGGIPEIIVNGRNGLLLDSRDPETIKEGMVSFLENREAHKRAAEEGYRTVQDKFLLSSQVKKIEHILEECLGEHGGEN
ncbi:MAG: glycosyltransferase family 4 protein [Candidatus Aminicenantes bacterium]|jgi:glycosyltransferase involved in cell wall biosynthesis